MDGHFQSELRLDGLRIGFRYLARVFWVVVPQHGQATEETSQWQGDEGESIGGQPDLRRNALNSPQLALVPPWPTVSTRLFMWRALP
jgi:hypothetical protein